MKEAAELIKAIATLLWPILGFAALIIFKNQIAQAIGRIKKGKFFGQEVELSEDLIKLQKTAIKASDEVASLPVIEDPNIEEAPSFNQEPDNSIKNIIIEAARSPKTALILLATEVEKEAKQTLASIGKLDGRRQLPIHQIVDELDSHYGLPKHVASSLKQFWETRNKIIHGGNTEKGNILSAIDSGVTILKTLRALPREKNWVYNEGVPIYSDPECKNEISDAKGIILKTESSSGSKVFYRIFPSTKTHFKKGTRVSWEWSFEKRWKDAWYRDPDSNEIKPAWSSSAEFIGRNLEEI